MTATRAKPELPDVCRDCGEPMDAIDTKVLDCFRGTETPRTTKYIYACRKSLDHKQLVVLDTPSTDYRAIIPASVYDESRERK